MQYQISDKGVGTKVITVKQETDELRPFLDKASRRLAEQKNLAGFRPGKAPRDLVEKKLGLAAIMDVALEEIISTTYLKIISTEKFSVIGRPQIEVKKNIPGELLEYTAEITLLPEVNLGKIENIRIKPEIFTVSNKEVEDVILDIRKMHAIEKKVERPAIMGDRVIIDFEVKLDNVVIDGGSGKDYPLILGDQAFIPGFEEKLVGLKPNTDVVFSLSFPQDYKPSLAGQEAEFTVRLKEVLLRELPIVDEDFLTKLGNYKDLEELSEQIKENLKIEKKQKSDQKFEIAILNELVSQSTFGDLPEILIENELHRMIHELEESVQKQNLTFDQYLQQIGKNKDDLKKEWREAAIKRVKTALVARQLAITYNIEVADEEIEKEKQALLESYQNRPEIKQNIESADFREYLFHTLTNRKVIEFLKEKIIENK
jgi:trigger factor